jgi:ribosomal protein S18 acetylase RimI-like enzyme
MTVPPPHPAASDVDLQPLTSDAQARECAEIMSTTDPWLRLGRTFDESYRIVCDPAREVYVALDPATGTSRVAGFTIIVMQGAFVGYIQTVAVRDGWQGRGLGTALIAFAEQRILRDEPNVFICVSSFNPRARRLYERLGYHVVGELTDYIARGHSEILLRKTTGPLISRFRAVRPKTLLRPPIRAQTVPSFAAVTVTERLCIDGSPSQSRRLLVSCPLRLPARNSRPSAPRI